MSPPRAAVPAGRRHSAIRAPLAAATAASAAAAAASAAAASSAAAVAAAAAAAGGRAAAAHSPREPGVRAPPRPRPCPPRDHSQSALPPARPPVHVPSDSAPSDGRVPAWSPPRALPARAPEVPSAGSPLRPESGAPTSHSPPLEIRSRDQCVPVPYGCGWDGCQSCQQERKGRPGHLSMPGACSQARVCKMCRLV